MQNIESVNQWFRKAGTVLLAWRWMIIAILIVLNILGGIGIPRIKTDSSSDRWFLDDDPLLVATDEFEAVFGNNEYAAILVEADDVFAPDILRMIRELGEELDEQIPIADGILSLTDFEFIHGTEEGIDITDLVPEDIPIDLNDIEEIRKLAFSKPFWVNRLFSDDSTQAWIMLRLQAYPDEETQDIVGHKVLEILNQEKYAPYTLKPSGDPVSTYERKLFVAAETRRLMLLALSTAILLLLVFLRTLRGVIIPLITVISSIVWTFGAMGYLGIRVDTQVITVPVFLGMAVSIGYSIHIFNFFHRQFSATGQRREAVVFALQETGWPILFTAATTIAALLSFFFVPITQIRWMGLSSAVTILTTYLIVMTLTPVLLSFGKNRQPTLAQRSGTRLAERLNMKVEDALAGLGQWTVAHSKVITGVFVVLVCIFVSGLPYVYVSLNYKEFYGLKVPYIARLHEIGLSKIGSIESYNVMLRFDNMQQAKDPEVLRNLDTLMTEIRRLPLVKRTSSLLDIVKEMNQVMHSDDPNYYGVPNNGDLIAQLLLLYDISNGTEQTRWVDYEYTTLRVMVEVSDYNTAEFEHAFHYIPERAGELFPDAEVSIVGGLMQAAVAQNYIARGEVVSSLIALVVIGFLIILVFRSVKIGLIGMIPNVTPVLVVGGIMGYAHIPIDMNTMMIMPVLLGLAVDDTIHFITHANLEFQRSQDYGKSIDSTFRTVGKAIFTTSCILIATFLVYGTSSIRCFNNMSLLAISGVSAALLADYFMTPILVNWSKPFRRK